MCVSEGEYVLFNVSTCAYFNECVCDFVYVSVFVFECVCACVFL